MLATQVPPNSGTLNTVGALKKVDLGSAVGFDIAGTTDFRAFALVQDGGSVRLYRVSLEDGKARRRAPRSRAATTDSPCSTATTTDEPIGERSGVIGLASATAARERPAQVSAADAAPSFACERRHGVRDACENQLARCDAIAARSEGGERRGQLASPAMTASAPVSASAA